MPPETPPAPPLPAPPGAARRPRRWLAALLSLVSPGLGHLYAGRARPALAIGAAWLAAQVLFAAAMRTGFAVFVAGIGLYAAAWIGFAGLAARAAGAAPERAGGRGRRALLLAAFVAAAWTAQAALGVPLRRHVAQGFAASSASMAPAVVPGDWIVAAPGALLERGAVVVHAVPGGPPGADPRIGRIAAVGGDEVAVQDGALLLGGRPVPRRPTGRAAAVEDWQPDGSWRVVLAVDFTESNGIHTYRTLCTPERACGDVARQQVPPGHLFLLGDRRDHSADSRVHGPVPEGSVLGTARYVYFSVGPAGVRWSRIGRAVE